MATWKAFVVLAANGLVQLTWVKQVNSDLDLIWQKGAPDGNVRMNSKFPGLELRIDQGDNVEVGFIREDNAIKRESVQLPIFSQFIFMGLNSGILHGLTLDTLLDRHPVRYLYHVHALKLQVTIQTKNVA
ncbi:Multicopper oxidase type 2 [Penicillium chrysogenum]|uniref:Multicopper oxidase type 2 n=1 Tax=Penicillium chrysogenum TaxID=5076 RepID=A0ABQ8WKF0_PENCH|nr:Multicopper oxidase type 2 [Penicillium chrysogenum]KAJ5251372.1 Multicopper oxidase type 2 [Penicillium chrysogenum]KAJ5270271.1 Multicopper oxidase type 2 [Penicillium chrysogenum]KAJ6146983.1 Multicopper oxidase type 2 [Penicillium chrysogenum]